jgi:hypothetical protein
MKYALLAVAALVMMAGTALADPIDPDFIKWSQLPLMTSNGYAFSSETLVPSLVADDFLCNDPAPITDIHWWGSYYTTAPSAYDANGGKWDDPSMDGPGDPAIMPNVISGFVFTFYDDIPAGSDPFKPFSHPGKALCSSFVSMSQIAVNLHGIIDHNNDAIIGNDGDKAVWQYTALLPVPFEQVPGTIYWLSIQAVNDMQQEVQWGWQESEDHWNDAAVQDGPWYMPGSGWNSLYVKDMAFELSIPEPATMALLGCGLALMGMARRRK